MAAVQRTLLGGERVAALWLYDAQIQKHVSPINYIYITFETKIQMCSNDGLGVSVFPSYSMQCPEHE